MLEYIFHEAARLEHGRKSQNGFLGPDVNCSSPTLSVRCALQSARVDAQVSIFGPRLRVRNVHFTRGHVRMITAPRLHRAQTEEEGDRRRRKQEGWGAGGYQELSAAKWDATCRPLTFTYDSQSIAPALQGRPPISGVL